MFTTFHSPTSFYTDMPCSFRTVWQIIMLYDIWHRAFGKMLCDKVTILCIFQKLRHTLSQLILSVRDPLWAASCTCAAPCPSRRRPSSRPRPQSLGSWPRSGARSRSSRRPCGRKRLGKNSFGLAFFLSFSKHNCRLCHEIFVCEQHPAFPVRFIYYILILAGLNM